MKFIVKRIKLSSPTKRKKCGISNSDQTGNQERVLKYQFFKADEIVNASLQNSTDITKEQIEAFRDTSYDGTLNNHGKHYQFANYMDGNWVHDFITPKGISTPN